MNPIEIPKIHEFSAKRYFTIGEVSNLCGVRPHVLRYWEQEFPQLKPRKRRGNRRYYKESDIFLVKNIKKLLYEQGFTIGGAKNKLASPEANSLEVSREKNAAIPERVKVDMIIQLQDIISELS